MSSRCLQLLALVALASACSLIFEAPKAAPDTESCTASCAAGCCSGDACITEASLNACGVPGSVCAVCDSDTADDCVDGACRCGDGPACAAGQECSSGLCFCSAESCASGCCGIGDLCRDRTLAACGIGGEVCQRCDPLRADTCSSEGFCKCGSDVGPCMAGQRCAGGSCVCDGLSCPDGCCDAADNCLPGTDTSACGSAGGACSVCTSGASPLCVDGACSGCTLGCTTGCCQGDTCQPAADGDPTVCNGLTGQACNACGIGADSCSPGGQCRCGANPACGAGQECVSGSCACTASSCPGGCCGAGQLCQSPAASSCGFGGEACQVCAAGQRCDDDGDCICDSVSCPNGCCTAAGTCSTSGSEESDSGCGTNGELCTQCPGGQECGSNGACTCTPASCPLGCCGLNQTCVMGAQTGGGPCVGSD